MVDQDEEDLQPDQQCWRPVDLEKMLRDGDKVSISKYCRFGLVHDKYARLKGLQVFSSHQEEYLPNSKQWGLGLSQLLDEGPAAVAGKLCKRSCDKLSSIPFEEFVRKAFGLTSDCIESFFWKYELLSVKLYSDLLRAPEYRDILLQLKKVSHHYPVDRSSRERSDRMQNLEEINSDPFTLAAIEHTWQKLLIQQQPRVVHTAAGTETLTQMLNR
jgi:hypothetical protein